MAKCFDVTGYIEPCNVVRPKYTGRALLITGNVDGGLLPVFSSNGLTITSLKGGENFFVFLSTFKDGGGEAYSVSIDAQNPFGVTIQGNTDSGRVSYTKTIPVTIPATRDGKAEAFIMGLQKGLVGISAIVLETFGINEPSDFFGSYSPLRLDPTSVTRNEYENGGAWTFNLICEEPVPNVVCTMTGLDKAIDTSNA